MSTRQAQQHPSIDEAHSVAAGTVEFGPRIVSINPPAGQLSTIVVITGSNLGTVQSVTFGGVPADFVSLSAIEIQTAVPVLAKTGPIVVRTTTGSAQTATNFSVSSLSPAVEVKEIIPAAGVAGDEVSINGQGFSRVTSLTFSGGGSLRVNDTNFVVLSDSLLECIVPPLARSGFLILTAKAAAVGAQPSMVGALFKIGTRPLPEIENFSPMSGPVGAGVQVNGRNFENAAIRSVEVNGVSAKYSVVSPTEILFTVPQGATTGPVSVSTDSAIVKSQQLFTVTS